MAELPPIVRGTIVEGATLALGTAPQQHDGHTEGPSDGYTHHQSKKARTQQSFAVIGNEVPTAMGLTPTQTGYPLTAPERTYQWDETPNPRAHLTSYRYRGERMPVGIRVGGSRPRMFQNPNTLYPPRYALSVAELPEDEPIRNARASDYTVTQSRDVPDSYMPSSEDIIQSTNYLNCTLQ